MKNVQLALCLMVSSVCGCGAPKSYVAATLNGIDTDSGNGALGAGAAVMVTGVVAVTDVHKTFSHAKSECRYEVWVQDPACQMGPCGLMASVAGEVFKGMDGGSKDCVAPRLSGTVLAEIKHGDALTIHGVVVVTPDSTPPGTVVEHEIDIDSLTVLAAVAPPPVLLIADPAVFSQLVAHAGLTWNQYEGMQLMVEPPMGGLTVSELVTGTGFLTMPGSTCWGDTFNNKYEQTKGIPFPTVGVTFKSISGVVSTRHGGSIMPIKFSDFVQ